MCLCVIENWKSRLKTYKRCSKMFFFSSLSKGGPSAAGVFKIPTLPKLISLIYFSITITRVLPSYLQSLDHKSQVNELLLWRFNSCDLVFNSCDIVFNSCDLVFSCRGKTNWFDKHTYSTEPAGNGIRQNTTGENKIA